jgi:diguanylate cyclase
VDPLALAAGVVAVAVSVGLAMRLRWRAQRAEAEAERLRGELQAERHAASHDPLTGLPNRRAFHQLGTALLADPARHPLFAVVIDLDDFKQINDRFGHAAGDEVLTVVARRLATFAGHNLVARLGGDEFAGLLDASTIDERRLDQATRRLADAIGAPMQLAGQVVTVSASIGLVPMHGSVHLAEALRHADEAMYRVKNCGQVGRPDPANAASDLVGYSAIRPSAPVRDLDLELEVGLAAGFRAGMQAQVNAEVMASWASRSLGRPAEPTAPVV